MMLYICTKFHENIFDNSQVMERTRFSYEKLQRGITLQKCRYVVLWCFIFVPSDRKLSLTFLERARFSLENFQRGIIPQKL